MHALHGSVLLLRAAGSALLGANKCCVSQAQRRDECNLADVLHLLFPFV
jgi:hypothetical protein